MNGNYPDYRNAARESLTRAKAEMLPSDPMRLRYAALELRFAIEALTYDRALAFKEDIPPEEYKTWQPSKLMAMLLEIDPIIVVSSTFSYSMDAESKNSVLQVPKRPMGTEHVLTMEVMNKNYNAIGNFLHIPSLKQIMSGKTPDLEKLKECCDKVISEMEKVLSSQVYNVTLGIIATLPQCLNDDCKKPVRRRIPPGGDSIDAQCFHCKAEYTISVPSHGETVWQPKIVETPCSTPTCGCTMKLFPKELVPGTHWRCSECKAHNGIALSVVRLPDN